MTEQWRGILRFLGGFILGYSLIQLITYLAGHLRFVK